MIAMVKFAFATTAVVVCVLSSATAQQPAPQPPKPECRTGAICFTGEVRRGEQFHKDLNADLEFSLENEWDIVVAPRKKDSGCDEDEDFTSAVNAPFRFHNQLMIDRSYGFTAEEETSNSPRQFSFVTDCGDQKTAMDWLVTVLWPADATKKEQEEAADKLRRVQVGLGRFWITDFRISHAGDTADDKRGTIEWMRFAVEIIFPKVRAQNAYPAAHK